jgi:hypothetical protein
MTFPFDWIKVTEDSPVGNEGDILVYNDKTHKVFVTPADILRAQLNQVQTKEMLKNWKGKMDAHLYHTGYYVSHWMSLPEPPKEGEHEKEIPKIKKKKDKSKRTNWSRANKRIKSR